MYLFAIWDILILGIGFDSYCPVYSRRVVLRSGSDQILRRLPSGGAVLSPILLQAARALLIVSGCIFLGLSLLTVLGVVLIELNGGVV